MRFLYQIIFLSIYVPFWACSEKEAPLTDFGFDYQPLKIGLFWTYKVSESIVFGENDAESSSFFYRNSIAYSYRNAENEEVFVLTKEKSANGIDWILQGNFSLQIRNKTLIQNSENQITVDLVFPPALGQKWNANIFISKDDDEYSIDLLGPYSLDDQDFSPAIRVLREEADDGITFRDNRYAIYTKGIGLIEEYYEVYTYCSRNDCLGKQFIDSGRMTHLKIIEYGQQ